MSSGPPKIADIKENIKNLFSPLEDELKALFDSGIVVPHQVLMFDELKVKSQMQICLLTNKILGPCREHVGNVSVKFVSEREVYVLLKVLDQGEVHMSVNIHVNDSNPWSLYIYL